MLRLINYFLVMVILSFLFISNVFAECSFKERKELLNQAKNVEAYFEPDLDNNKFSFYLYNLTDDIYAELVNLDTNQSFEIHKYQLEDGSFSLDIDNISERMTYRLYIKSNVSNCYSYNITNKTLIKGIINKYYSDNVCKGIEEYLYCQPVLNENFNLSDEAIYRKIYNYKESLEVSTKQEIKQENAFIAFIKKYWKYVLVISIVIIAIVILLIKLSKKRGEL